jgi:hypothetical protein
MTPTGQGEPAPLTQRTFWAPDKFQAYLEYFKLPSQHFRKLGQMKTIDTVQIVPYAFLQHRRLATARPEKKNQRATAPADFASRAPRHPRTHRWTAAAAMPALPKMDLQRAAA